MKILSAAEKSSAASKASVVYLSEEDMKKTAACFKEILAPVFKDKLFKGKEGEVLFLPTKEGAPHLILTGLGKEKSFSAENARRASAAAVKAMSRAGLKSGSFQMKTLEGKGKEDMEALARAAAEGAALAGFQFLDFKKEKKELEKGHKVESLVFSFSEKSLSQGKAGVETGKILGSAVNEAKRLANFPGNFMTPEQIGKEVLRLTRNSRIKTEVWNKARIQKEKMGGLLGVAQGSAEEPRFITMTYKGAAGAPVVLAGKGVTFDSGGISLKPGSKMDEMKFDMCGAAAVIGAMLAVEKLKLKVHVQGLVAAAENMPDGRALKPGDIIKARNGKTMEILNTDAEGRLLLADTLCYACEQKPRAVFDAATLTGAVVGALGNLFTGFFTKSHALKERIESAGLRSGERLWPLPLVKEHRKDMQSCFADIANLSSSYGAGSSTASAFLEFFVDEKIPYAHFDIAGTAWSMEKRLEYCAPKAASGVMVRTFTEIVRSFEAEDGKEKRSAKKAL